MLQLCSFLFSCGVSACIVIIVAPFIHFSPLFSCAPIIPFLFDVNCSQVSSSCIVAVIGTICRCALRPVSVRQGSLLSGVISPQHSFDNNLFLFHGLSHSPLSLSRLQESPRISMDAFIGSPLGKEFFRRLWLASHCRRCATSHLASFITRRNHSLGRISIIHCEPVPISIHVFLFFRRRSHVALSRRSPIFSSFLVSLF